MNVLVKNIKGIMLVSGMLTTTMVYAALSPAAALQSTFGEALTGPAVELVVRSWAILITIIGLMLIHGAFNVATREMALFAAGLSKLAFVGLVLSHGVQFLNHGAGLAVAVDALTVVLFVAYGAMTFHRSRRLQPAL